MKLIEIVADYVEKKQLRRSVQPARRMRLQKVGFNAV